MKVTGDGFLYLLLVVYLPKSPQLMFLSFIIFWGKMLPGSTSSSGSFLLVNLSLCCS